MEPVKSITDNIYANILFFHEYSLLNIQKIDKEKNNKRLDSFPIIMKL